MLSRLSRHKTITGTHPAAIYQNVTLLSAQHATTQRRARPSAIILSRCSTDNWRIAKISRRTLPKCSVTLRIPRSAVQIHILYCVDLLLHALSKFWLLECVNPSVQAVADVQHRCRGSGRKSHFLCTSRRLGLESRREVRRRGRFSAAGSRRPVHFSTTGSQREVATAADPRRRCPGAQKVTFETTVPLRSLS